MPDIPSHRRRPRRSLAALAAIALAGCAALAPRAGTGALLVRPEFQAAPYRVQAAVTPYSEASVDHVVFKLFVLTDSAETEVPGAAKDLARTALAAGVPFDGLALGTTYRLRAYAYQAPGTATGDKISLDASSSVDVSVGQATTVAIATLSIYLADRSFAGRATGSLAVADGTLATPSSAVTATWAPAP